MKIIKGNKNYPHVVICLTTYNPGPTLEHLLSSLLRLDYPRKKLYLVIVDDYSNDGTWEKLLEFKQEHNNAFNNIIMNRSYSRNVAKARNTCLKLALEKCPYADFVFILDHDILVPPNILKVLVNHLMQDPTLGSAHGLRVSMSNNIFEQIWRALWPKHYGYVEWADIECTLIRVKVFKDIGFFNESMTRWENREFIARLRRAGYKVLIDTRIKCIHLSVSHQTRQAMGYHAGLSNSLKSILKYYFKVLPPNVEHVFKAEKVYYKVRVLYYALLPYAVIVFTSLNMIPLGISLIIIPFFYHGLRLCASPKVKIIGSVIIISQKILVAQALFYYKVIKALKLGHRSRYESS